MYRSEIEDTKSTDEFPSSWNKYLSSLENTIVGDNICNFPMDLC